MATVIQVYAVAFVDTVLDEDPEMLEATVSDYDNLSHGTIVSVHKGQGNRTWLTQRLSC